MWGVNELADRVRRERLTRGWSVRRAATESGIITNTWWQRFEDGQQPLTDSINAAVVAAFGWPTDWATQQPDGDQRAALQELVSLAVMRATRSLAEQVEEMGAAIEQLRARLDQQPPSSGEAQS